MALVGPTAIGKTSLALDLARLFDLEVVSADSRQIYRGLDIGTAKPTPAELNRVPHHLVDVVDPSEVLTLAQYQESAFAAIAGIQSRHRLPLLVGGTGLYIWSVVENWRIPRVPPNPEVRLLLEARAEALGADHLHHELASVDPAAAAGIDPRNVRRVIRALEVYEVTGRPISAQQGREPPRYRCLILGLTAAREGLYARADIRVDRMIEAGLLRETSALLETGLDPEVPALTGIGYRQMIEHLQGRCSLEEARERIKTTTHRFIRQQNTWFRRDDPRITWLDFPFSVSEVAPLVSQFLEE